MSSVLSVVFRSLIAAVEGVDIATVTPGFVEEKRIKKIYPIMRYDAPPGIFPATLGELDKINAHAQKFLDTL